MKNMFKRIVSLLMVLVLAGSMLPVSHVHGEETKESTVLTDEDYAIVNDVFARIDAMEDAPAKKSAKQSQLTDAAIEIVVASENYVEGSLERNGDAFFWMTDVGIRCGYNPRMREIRKDMIAPEVPEETGVVNEPIATKGGWPTTNQVYLIGPYYNSDSNFTDQYKNEAADIAKAIGDTDGYTLYADSAATIDNIAKAISSGAVVIFDSHGSTDYAEDTGYTYEDGEPIYECVSGANYSYLCLSSKNGLTTADYDAGAIWDGYDAYVNGAAIANHMTSNSPGGLLWMAICLGMATDTICEPMREKGVEVVYGYSQSVTFHGDYCFEGTFWDSMCQGDSVATAISTMKSTWGNWDWSTQIATYYGYSDGYSNISSARADWCAFPVVVSDEDAHPGQRNDHQQGVWGACSLQTVKSTYTLFSQYEVTVQSNNTAYGTVSVSGNTITAVPANGYFAQGATVLSGTATVTQNGNTFSVVAESDCVVQINFAAKTAVTVNFSGANVSGKTGYAGDSVELPTATAPEGCEFVGWTTAPLSSDTTEKPAVYTDSFVPTGNTTLYALYSYVDTTSGGGSGDYVKVTSTPSDWSGDYLIVYENGTQAYIFNSVDGTNGYISAAISNGTIESNATTDAEAVTIEAMSGGYAIKSKKGYISGTSGANKLNFNTSSQQLNTLSMAADGTVLITSNTSVLRFNATSGQYRFRYYKAASYKDQKGVVLYVKDGSAGTTYYTSSLCDHTKTSPVDAVAPTCTEVGYTAGTQCDACGNYVTGHEVVAALGHSMDSGVVTKPATCTAEGVKTYTCQDCGKTETESIPMTEHNYIEDGQMLVCTECGSVLDNTTLKTGDQVVIFAPAYNKALSVKKVSTYYNAGVDIVVSGDTVTGYTDTEVWTVVENADGSYSFAYGGQNLGMAESYTSMDLGQIHDTWNVISLGDGLYNIQNTGRGHYMEWYSEKGSWSGYDTSSAATDARLQLSFYVVGKGILGADTAQPDTSEPTTVPTQPSEPSEPSNPGQITSLQYVFSDYAAGTQYAQNEVHKLDDTVTLTVNGAHLNGTIRLYAGSNVVFTSPKVIDSIVVNVGNEPSTMNVYGSVDGKTWDLISAQSVVATYKDYTFKISNEKAYTFLKLESIGKQIRIPQMTIHVIEPAEEVELVAGMAMTLGAEMQVGMYLNFREDVIVNVGGKDIPVSADALMESEDGFYIATVAVAAAQMTDSITVRRAGEDPDPNTPVYTVRDYADWILADSQYSKYHALVKEMLNYGGQAQIYFDHNADDLANEGITDVNAEDVPESTTELSVTGTVEGISFYAASLVYRDKVALRFYFKTTAEAINSYTFKANGVSCKPVQKGDYYYIEVADITPDKLDQQVSVVVTGAGDTSLTVQYSPMNYIVRMSSKGEDSLKALLKALYNYHLASKDIVAGN